MPLVKQKPEIKQQGGVVQDTLVGTGRFLRGVGEGAKYEFEDLLITPEDLNNTGSEFAGEIVGRMLSNAAMLVPFVTPGGVPVGAGIKVLQGAKWAKKFRGKDIKAGVEQVMKTVSPYLKKMAPSLNKYPGWANKAMKVFAAEAGIEGVKGLTQTDKDGFFIDGSEGFRRAMVGGILSLFGMGAGHGVGHLAGKVTGGFQRDKALQESTDAALNYLKKDVDFVELFPSILGTNVKNVTRGGTGLSADNKQVWDTVFYKYPAKTNAKRDALLKEFISSQDTASTHQLLQALDHVGLAPLSKVFRSWKRKLRNEKKKYLENLDSLQKEHHAWKERTELSDAIDAGAGKKKKIDPAKKKKMDAAKEKKMMEEAELFNLRQKQLDDDYQQAQKKISDKSIKEYSKVLAKDANSAHLNLRDITATKSNLQGGLRGYRHGTQEFAQKFLDDIEAGLPADKSVVLERIKKNYPHYQVSKSFFDDTLNTSTLGLNNPYIHLDDLAKAIDKTQKAGKITPGYANEQYAMLRRALKGNPFKADNVPKGIDAANLAASASGFGSRGLAGGSATYHLLRALQQRGGMEKASNLFKSEDVLKFEKYPVKSVYPYLGATIPKAFTGNREKGSR